MERTPRYGPEVEPQQRAEAAACLARAIMAIDRAIELVPGVPAVETARTAVVRAYRDEEFVGTTDYAAVVADLRGMLSRLKGRVEGVLSADTVLDALNNYIEDHTTGDGA